MSEKRFRVRFEQEDGRGEIVNEKGVELTAREVVDLLNEQQATIIAQKKGLDEYMDKIIALSKENEQLRQELNDCEKFRHSIFKRMNELTDQLKEKEEDEKLYAQEIVELNKTKKELIEFNELGGDY